MVHVHTYPNVAYINEPAQLTWTQVFKFHTTNTSFISSCRILTANFTNDSVSFLTNWRRSPHRCPKPHLWWVETGRAGGGGGWGRGKWGQCKIKLITSNYATDLIGERDSVRSLSSPIIRPVRDPSEARLIRRTLMKLAKQLLFLDSWARSGARVGNVCGNGGGEVCGEEECGITDRIRIAVEL